MLPTRSCPSQCIRGLPHCINFRSVERPRCVSGTVAPGSRSGQAMLLKSVTKRAAAAANTPARVHLKRSFDASTRWILDSSVDVFSSRALSLDSSMSMANQIIQTAQGCSRDARKGTARTPWPPGRGVRVLRRAYAVLRQGVACAEVSRGGPAEWRGRVLGRRSRSCSRIVSMLSDRAHRETSRPEMSLVHGSRGRNARTHKQPRRFGRNPDGADGADGGSLG